LVYPTFLEEDSESDREVKTWTSFFDISRGEIDGNFCARKWEIRILDSTSDTFTTLLNSGIWKSDDDKSWHAVVDVDFDFYELSVES
jgi:hypothetical protein